MTRKVYVWREGDEICANFQKDNGAKVSIWGLSPDLARALADAIYADLRLGWRPYPENTPTHSGQYIVQLKDNDVILAEWVEDVADPYFYYRNDAEIVAYREYIPYKLESESQDG